MADNPMTALADELCLTIEGGLVLDQTQLDISEHLTQTDACLRIRKSRPRSRRTSSKKRHKHRSRRHRSMKTNLFVFIPADTFPLSSVKSQTARSARTKKSSISSITLSTAETQKDVTVTTTRQHDSETTQSAEARIFTPHTAVSKRNLPACVADRVESDYGIDEPTRRGAKDTCARVSNNARRCARSLCLCYSRTLVILTVLAILLFSAAGNGLGIVVLNRQQSPICTVKKLNQWSPWSECNTTCGPGQRHRGRTVVVDGHCAIETSENKYCYEKPCCRTDYNTTPGLRHCYKIEPKEVTHDEMKTTFSIKSRLERKFVFNLMEANNISSVWTSIVCSGSQEEVLRCTDTAGNLSFAIFEPFEKKGNCKNKDCPVYIWSNKSDIYYMITKGGARCNTVVRTKPTDH